MRYRPFGHFKVSVSAISLVLGDEGPARSADDWTKLVYAALEGGVNAFEIQGRSPQITQGLNQALQHVDRNLIFVALRIGPRTIPPQFAAQAFEPKMIQASVQSVLARTGLSYLDLLMLDEPGEQDLSSPGLAMLKEQKSGGKGRLIGVAGENPSIAAYISTRQFDTLGLPFNMLSGWRDRLRLRAAQDQDMAVVGYDFCPDVLIPDKATDTGGEPKRRLWKRKPVKMPPPGAYEFLAYTPGWTVADICLAFSLTEPSLATILVDPRSIEELQAFCMAADREMPPGLSAQIEMARVMATTPPAQQSA